MVRSVFSAPQALLRGRETECIPDEPGSAGAGTSSVSLSIAAGPGFAVWSPAGSIYAGKTEAERKVQLQAHRPVIIGRQEGGAIDYLDPLYVSTPIIPETGRSILTLGEQDRYVSRGHFMLRATPHGIMLINGVPCRDGGVRPPRNGTWLLMPVARQLGAGEEYFIERGHSARIRLPNGTVILIRAE